MSSEVEFGIFIGILVSSVLCSLIGLCIDKNNGARGFIVSLLFGVFGLIIIAILVNGENHKLTDVQELENKNKNLINDVNNLHNIIQNLNIKIHSLENMRCKNAKLQAKNAYLHTKLQAKNVKFLATLTKNKIINGINKHQYATAIVLLFIGIVISAVGCSFIAFSQINKIKQKYDFKLSTEKENVKQSWEETISTLENKSKEYDRENRRLRKNIDELQSQNDKHVQTISKLETSRQILLDNVSNLKLTIQNANKIQLEIENDEEPKKHEPEQKFDEQYQQKLENARKTREKLLEKLDDN